MLIFIFVKIMNVFLFVVMRLSVRSIKKYHSSQSAGNVSIYQNIFKKFFLKIAPPKNSFSKVLPQKIHFRNCSLKNAFSKLIPQKFSFKITYLSEEEKSLKLSFIYLITFFSIHLHSFKNICG